VSVFTLTESGKANHWQILMKNKSGTLKKKKFKTSQKKKRKKAVRAKK
jgi:hypothetical protein